MSIFYTHFYTQRKSILPCFHYIFVAIIGLTTIIGASSSSFAGAETTFPYGNDFPVKNGILSLPDGTPDGTGFYSINIIGKRDSEIREILAKYRSDTEKRESLLFQRDSLMEKGAQLVRQRTTKSKNGDFSDFYELSQKIFGIDAEVRALTVQIAELSTAFTVKRNIIDLPLLPTQNYSAQNQRVDTATRIAREAQLQRVNFGGAAYSLDNIFEELHSFVSTYTNTEGKGANKFQSLLLLSKKQLLGGSVLGDALHLQTDDLILKMNTIYNILSGNGYYSSMDDVVSKLFSLFEKIRADKALNNSESIFLENVLSRIPYQKGTLGINELSRFIEVIYSYQAKSKLDMDLVDFIFDHLSLNYKDIRALVLSQVINLRALGYSVSDAESSFNELAKMTARASNSNRLLLRKYMYQLLAANDFFALSETAEQAIALSIKNEKSENLKGMPDLKAVKNNEQPIDSMRSQMINFYLGKENRPEIDRKIQEVTKSSFFVANLFNAIQAERSLTMDSFHVARRAKAQLLYGKFARKFFVKWGALSIPAIPESIAGNASNTGNGADITKLMCSRIFK